MKETALVQSIVVLEKARKTGHVLRNIVAGYVQLELLPYETIEVVDGVQSLFLMHASLLALTWSRYSELEQIDIHRFLQGERQTIVQPKTKANKTIQGQKYYEYPDIQGIFNRTSELCVSYESVRYAVSGAVPLRIRKRLVNSSDSTHVFRHLNASFWRYKGMSDEEIAEQLGHLTTDSNAVYLHEGLLVPRMLFSRED